MLDHAIFARGLIPACAPEMLDRTLTLDGHTVELSDHVPLAIDLMRG